MEEVHFLLFLSGRWSHSPRDGNKRFWRSCCEPSPQKGDPWNVARSFKGSADGEGISFFFLRGMFGEGEDSPSFLFMKPTIWREIYSLRILQKVRNIYQRDSRFITLGLTPWFVDVHHAKTFQRSATNGKVMFQEEQAEKARLQQQRQKMKEDPELKPRCRRLVFGYCLYHWMVFSPLLGHTCGVQKVTFQTSRGEATAAAWESSTGGETVSIRGQRLDGSPNIAKWMNQNLEIW